MQARTMPFAGVLASAIRARGLSLERVRHRLDELGTPLSLATLSYWQSGRSRPTRARSLLAVANLETILELEPGTLVHSLTDGQPAFDWEQVPAPASLVEQTMSELGIDELTVFGVAYADHVLIGADRAEVMHHCDSVVICTQDGGRAFPAVLAVGCDRPTEITVTESQGCRLGRHRSLPEHGLLVGELELPAPLRKGETAACSVTARWPSPGCPSTRWERGSHGRVRSLMLRAEFHPDALPQTVQAFHRPQGRGPEDERILGDIELAGTTALLYLSNPGTGVHGLQWRWEQ